MAVEEDEGLADEEAAFELAEGESEASKTQKNKAP